MKKVFILVMTAVMAFGISSCTNKAAEKAQHEADSIEAARIADSIATAEAEALAQQALLDSLRADSLQRAIEDSIAAAQAAAKAKTTKTTKTQPAAQAQPEEKKKVNNDRIEAAIKAKQAQKEAETTAKAVDAGTQAAKDAVQETNKTVTRRVK